MTTPTTLQNLKKLPGVLSFTRCMTVSDGVFSDIEVVDDDHREHPTNVVRHGIRGTQNVNNSKQKDVSNIQVTETAKTRPSTSKVSVEYTLTIRPLESALHSCAGNESDQFRNNFADFVERAEQGSGIDEVGRRIARNVLNGRWLWRNRSLGEAITVESMTKDGDGRWQTLARADALDVPTHHFSGYSDDEIALGQHIAKGLRGEDEGNAPVHVVALIDLGFSGSVEVHPSENYVSNKPDGFARALYKLNVNDQPLGQTPIDFDDTRVMGRAALRDQKIGNALRTIDTWYPGAPEQDAEPIAVEPQGANLGQMTFYRRQPAKASAFNLALRLPEIDPDSEDGMFMIAALIRGGVYGESDK
ncbi:type I-F CRISPR-associated protein Csy3 [Halomonadaceae bacterium KBTZ08]